MPGVEVVLIMHGHGHWAPVLLARGYCRYHPGDNLLASVSACYEPNDRSQVGKLPRTLEGDGCDR
jgi:hypothetical protein